jgi:prefoldin subunit 5
VKDISEYLKEEKNKKENNRFDPWEIEGYKTLVDIGNHCYVQGVISKEALAKSIFVHIGLGFHAEIKLEDIPAFSFQRIAILERKRSKVESELLQVQNDHREVSKMFLRFSSLYFLFIL